MEAGLHVQWDLYGTFCIVPSFDDANPIFTALRDSNNERKEVGSDFERPLNVCVFLFLLPLAQALP